MHLELLAQVDVDTPPDQQALVPSSMGGGGGGKRTPLSLSDPGLRGTRGFNLHLQPILPTYVQFNLRTVEMY